MLKFELTNYWGDDVFTEYIDKRPLELRMKSAKEEEKRNGLAKLMAISIIDYTIDWQIENNVECDEEHLWEQIPWIEKDLQTHDYDYLKELNEYIMKDPVVNSAWFYDVCDEGGKRWQFRGFADDYTRETIKNGNNIIERITRIK